jgi:hypothetical protein
MANKIDKPKQRRGRPRIHKGNPKVLSIRTTEQRADLINGLLATIRLAERKSRRTQ